MEELTNNEAEMLNNIANHCCNINCVFICDIVQTDRDMETLQSLFEKGLALVGSEVMQLTQKGFDIWCFLANTMFDSNIIRMITESKE